MASRLICVPEIANGYPWLDGFVLNDNASCKRKALSEAMPPQAEPASASIPVLQIPPSVRRMHSDSGSVPATPNTLRHRTPESNERWRSISCLGRAERIVGCVNGRCRLGLFHCILHLLIRYAHARSEPIATNSPRHCWNAESPNGNRLDRDGLIAVDDC